MTKNHWCKSLLQQASQFPRSQYVSATAVVRHRSVFFATVRLSDRHRSVERNLYISATAVFRHCTMCISLHVKKWQKKPWCQSLLQQASQFPRSLYISATAVVRHRSVFFATVRLSDRHRSVERNLYVSATAVFTFSSKYERPIRLNHKFQFSKRLTSFVFAWN